MTASARRTSLAGALWLVGLLTSAEAHPVAQGSVEIHVERHQLLANFRVSNEQVFVASAFGAKEEAPAGLDQLWQEHAVYLLEHVRATVEGIAIAGDCVRVVPPENPTIDGFAHYELRFVFPRAEPRRVVMSADPLREIEFAPRNSWEATFAARVHQRGRLLHEALLITADQPLDLVLDWSPAGELDAAPSDGLRRLGLDFFLYGVRHIAAGWDHVLFVAALVLAVARFWHVIALVTSFTVAHTITLTLAVLRLAQLPGALVEPMIAASIVAAAALNFFPPRQAPLTARLAVAFGFGLFHGLGFASGLTGAMSGFTTGALAVSIGAFSVGVEVGHQLVVIPLVLVGFGVRRFTRAAALWTARIASAAVMLAGAWLLALALGWAG
jgi:hypothetical protein